MRFLGLLAALLVLPAYAFALNADLGALDALEKGLEATAARWRPALKYSLGNKAVPGQRDHAFNTCQTNCNKAVKSLAPL